MLSKEFTKNLLGKRFDLPKEFVPQKNGNLLIKKLVTYFLLEEDICSIFLPDFSSNRILEIELMYVINYDENYVKWFLEFRLFDAAPIIPYRAKERWWTGEEVEKCIVGKNLLRTQSFDTDTKSLYDFLKSSLLIIVKSWSLWDISWEIFQRISSFDELIYNGFMMKLSEDVEKLPEEEWELLNKYI
jgi:hypothetical protein